MDLDVISREQADSRSDTDLIASINAGEAGAFDTLYFRYRDWVVNLAWRLTNDREIALDILQDTFLYLVKKFPGFQLTAQMKTFLYPAVRNLSIAARRKSLRFQSSEEDLQHIQSASAAESNFGEADQLATILVNLSEGHREVMLLRFVDGLSLGEIAQALDIPLGTVKSRLHVALGTLRNDPRTKSLFYE